MSKRLVVCCDGTWNTPDQQTPTNVTKLALAIEPRDPTGREQRTFYHCGVGTKKRERFRGGAFGFGLWRDVCDAYRFLVESFEPGDELYFFGFSRGAFAARSTAGLVRNCGILRPEHADRVDEAYELYRSRRPDAHPHSVEAALFRRSFSHETRIRFIGVWDTVGALGIPINGLRFFNVINRRWQFHDTTLSTTVDAAFQALAIDEERRPFKPTLWEQQAYAPEHQRVEQVWFAGVHCDVGGGYLQHGLSDIALLWMVDRAREYGLAFNPVALTTLRPSDPMMRSGSDEIVRSHTHVDPDPLGALHQSWNPAYFWPEKRRLGVTDAAHEYVASSAIERHNKRPSYVPSGLLAYLSGAHRIMEVCARRVSPAISPHLLRNRQHANGASLRSNGATVDSEGTVPRSACQSDPSSAAATLALHS